MGANAALGGGRGAGVGELGGRQRWEAQLTALPKPALLCVRLCY